MAETKMQLADWLDDLCVRFIVNLPQEELESAERICFQVEEAQWFYEDFVRPLDASLPSMNLRTFCMAIFRVCPLLSAFSPEQHFAAYSQFLAYKTRVPVRGAILLNEKMDQALLVKGWKKGASWSFPRGKINKDETDLDCAIREVYEETGYDLASAGIVPEESDAKSIEVTMKGQHLKMYVFRDVPMDTVFQARTRKEISKIMWWKLSQLPGYHKKKTKNNTQTGDDSGDSIKANKLYMVAPFLPSLKKWIGEQRKLDSHRRTASDAYLSTGDFQVTDADVILEDELPSDVPAQNIAPLVYDISTALPQMVSNSCAGSIPHGVPLDASAQMKRLLGVSEPAAGTAEPEPAQSNQLPSHQRNLLSMFANDNQSRAQAPAQGQFQPPFSAAPSPLQHAQPSQHHLGRFEAQTPVAVQQTVVPSYTHQNAPADVYNTAITPYQRTAGNEIARPSAGAQVQGPIVPSASELPMPKLSNHAMNLLNMFKEPLKQEGLLDVSRNTTQPAQRPRPSKQQDARDHDPSLDPQRSSARAAFGNLVPSTVKPLTSSGVPRPQTSSRQPDDSNDQQTTLLNLFKSNSTTMKAGSTQERAPQRPDGNAMESNQQKQKQSNSDTLLGLFKSQGAKPSEPDPSIPLSKGSLTTTNSNPLLQLLNQSSTGPSPALDTSGDLQHRVKSVPTAPAPEAQAVKAQQPKPVIRGKPIDTEGTASTGSRGTQPVPQTAATGSRESGHEPNRNVFRQSQEADPPGQPRRKKQGTKTALQKAERSQGSPSGPVQILKRPTTAESLESSSPKATPPAVRQELATPSKPVTRTSSEASKKPFAPQILRRPQSGSPSQAIQQNPASSSGRSTSAKEDQQKALLTLLSGGKRDSGPSSVLSAAKSTSSAAQESSNPPSPGTKMELSRSRISSVASPPSGEPPPRSRMNSAASLPRAGTPLRGPSVGGTGSGAQTPISPADKGFLVNYLEGVLSRGVNK